MLDNVDHVICISLRHRTDRRKKLESQWKKTGIDVEYLLVDKDEKDPQRGCFNSHKLCAQLALERGYNNILIFEDDVVFENRIFTKQFQRIDYFIKKYKYDVFYLGVILGKMWLTWHKNIARCRAAGAHAYILSKKACHILCAHEYAGFGVDKFYKMKFKGFCAFPMLCRQLPGEASKSDLDGFRHSDAKDFAFWEANRKKQYKEVLVNFHKTLLNR